MVRGREPGWALAGLVVGAGVLSGSLGLEALVAAPQLLELDLFG